MSGKGSRQRPGQGYAEGWDAIFGNKEPELDAQAVSMLSKFDPAEYLKTEESRAAFLGEFESESKEAIEQARDLVKRSREMWKED